MMKRSFLYQLYHHSKKAFVLALAFIVCYAVIISKKMDMVFFPHNSMYAQPPGNMPAGSTYMMWVNGTPVKISARLYWKKDFLESSLATYTKYIIGGQKVYLDHYIGNATTAKRAWLLNSLTPSEHLAKEWPLWFARFAGYSFQGPASIDIFQYNYIFKNNKAILTDSARVYSGTISL
jgi:hypothetical protein